MFGVTSAICATYPNSVGLPSLPLRIGRASGSESEISRSVIFSPRTRCVICGDLLASIGELVELGCRAQLRLGAAAACAAPRSRREAPRLLHRARQQLAGLARHVEHFGLRFSGAPADRAGDRAQPAAHRTRTVANADARLADRRRDLAALAGQALDALRRQAGVGRVLDVGLDHRRIDPDRPRAEPLLADRGVDQRPDDVVDRLLAHALGELADRRLVAHKLAERDPAEAPQMHRVRYLRDQRPVAPTVTLLEDHQPHIGLDRDRRPAMIGRRDPGLQRLALPMRCERRHQHRI